MMRIHYAGTSQLTGTDIGNAVLDLSEQLGISGTASTVTFPIRMPDGSVGQSRLLVGPASQMASEIELSNFAEVRDEELVRTLNKQTTRLRPHTAVQAEDNDVITWDPDTEPVPPARL